MSKYTEIEQKHDHEFGKKTVRRGFSYTELTEEQHREALGVAFANGPVKTYKGVIKALMEGYTSIGFKRSCSIITDLKKILTYKRMIEKDESVHLSIRAGNSPDPKSTGVSATAILTGISQSCSRRAGRLMCNRHIGMFSNLP